MAKVKSNSRTKNSLLNILTGFSGHFLLIVFKFAVRTVFIKILGESYLGINGLYSDIMTMLSLTELGFDTAINYKLYKPLTEHDDKRVRVLLNFYRSAYRIVGLVVMALGLCLIPLLPVIIKDYDSLEALHINATLVFLLYLAQSVSSYWFFAYQTSVVKAAQREYILNIANYITTILSNVVQILILLLTKNFVWYVASIVITTILQNIIYAIVANHYFPEFFIKEQDRITKEERNEILKDCAALFVYQVNFVVIKATDNLVLSTFMGLVTVGLYSNYLLFYTTIRSLLDRFYNAVKASLGNLFTSSDVAKKYHFFQVMNLITVILYGVAGVGIATIADELIQTWVGDKYVIAQPLALLVGVEILFVGIKKNLGQTRNVSGAFRQMWYRPIIGIVINIAVSVILVQVIGIYGILIGTISADIFANFLFDPRVIYKYSLGGYRPVKDYYFRNLGYFAVLTVAGGICWLVNSYVLTGFGWVSVIFHACVCVVVVPALFWIVYRKTEEFQYILSTMKRIVNRKIG